MKYPSASPIELLKSVLANLREPDLLNDHPWAVMISGPRQKDSGARLINLVIVEFRKMIPSGPPRMGKRLDTRWGAFGILASQHFAPAILGTPTPTSLREAWESLDRSILFFVFGHTDGLSEDERIRYRFAENEIEPAPNSTLSDWHRKGIEQLAEMVTLELRRISIDKKPLAKIRKVMKSAGIVLVSILLILVVFVGWKAWGFYQRILVIEEKVGGLENYLNPTPKLEQIPEISAKVHDLRADLDALQSDTDSFIWMVSYLGWVPRYGGDISQAESLLSLAQNLVTATDEGLTAVTPAVKMTLKNNQPLDVMDLILKLQEASPQLLNAQVALAQAQVARNRIDVERLSSPFKQLVTERIDPLFQAIIGSFSMEDALTMVRIAPKLLGSGKVGPQTYLVLMQNEDELRPTGGYLTAAGSAVVKDGKLISINIESSELVEDLSKPYPSSPWQFKEFMNVEKLLFRDSNWFTDFPTTASWAEYFYSYARASSADGVIAIDMHVIVRLLKVLGPIRVENVNYPITSDNVLEYMRSAEEAAPKGITGKWDRKQFIGKLAQPLLEKVLQARGQTWTTLFPVMTELLAEKHILLQFDDDEAAKLIERLNWDGAVRIPANSDFLMVVDTNMGYNKSNAVMKLALEYTVNLAKLNQAEGVLRVWQTNFSKAEALCESLYTTRFFNSDATSASDMPGSIYNIDECHWGYLRIYLPKDTVLLRSTPREIPAESTMLGETIPARTDDLGSEDIPNAQVFGTMVITPTHDSTNTEFEYTLPPGVLTRDEKNDLWVYRLKVQKQPGTLAYSFTLNLHLPIGARIESMTVPFVDNLGVWTAQLDLHRDLTIEVRFTLK